MGTYTKLQKTLYGLYGTDWVLISSAYLNDGEIETTFKRIEQMCNGHRQSMRFGNVVVRNNYDAYRIN